MNNKKESRIFHRKRNTVEGRQLPPLTSEPTLEVPEEFSSVCSSTIQQESEAHMKVLQRKNAPPSIDSLPGKKLAQKTHSMPTD